MKKATKAAIFVTAAAALYGAAAYGVTRTLMDVAMKREAPKALKNKGSAQLTGEKRDACAAPCKLLVVPGADHAMSYYMGRGAYEAAVRAFWEHFDK